MKTKLIPFTVLFIATLLLFTSLTKSPMREKKKMFHVNGMILLVSEYCGGAAPTPELQQREHTPYAQPKTTLYLRDGNANYNNKPILDSITSDSTGKFSINLPAGTYCVVEKYKTNKFTYPNDKIADWDTACYRKSFERCDFVLDVARDMDSVKIVLAHNCVWKNPCVKNYHGPRPGQSAPGKGFPSGKEMPPPPRQ